MTMETITAATPAAPLERAVWRAEIIETVKLAWPIALTQLGQIAMMTTDLALIGRLGDDAIAAVPVNGLLAYALINGAFGAPRLDLLGAGLATTFVNVAMCAAAIWICYICRPFKKYRVLGRFWRADWELLRELIAIGLPISGGFMLEWGLFSSGALLMGWIGTTALAAHQIALQVAAILL